MPLSGKHQVDLPTSGIIVRKTGNHYVYKVLETFRNDKGQPTNTRIGIGRLDPKSGKLIPNDNYWKYYDYTTPAIQPSESGVISIDGGIEAVKSVGTTFLLERLLENEGIAAIINSIFGVDRAGMIMIAVMHMALNGNVFEHIGDWCEDNVISEARLTSMTSSALFASITYGERMRFFKAWISSKRSIGDEYYAYDVTSFSTYARSICDAEFGYNRDGEDLPQINLGCYFNQQIGLPMFYVTYPGSIVDKSHLPHMMAYNHELGVSNARFVMDKGFCSTENLKYMHSNGFSFLMAVGNSTKTVSSAIDSAKPKIMSMQYRIKSGVYGLTQQGVFFGIKSTLHIFYQPALDEQQRNSLLRRIENQEETLSKLSAITQTEARKYRKYLNISVSKDGSFTYSRNYAAIDEKASRCGYLCLITDIELSAAEALEIYRRKDVIEKSFDDIKNHADMKRLRTHNSATTDGKMFCAFVSLIVVSAFANFLNQAEEFTLTKSEAFEELAKVRLVVTDDGRRLMNPLTKMQRLLLEACHLNEQELISFIGKLSTR